MDTVETKPMDVAELKKCAACGMGVMHRGSPVFYRVTVEQCIVDTRNVQRMHGMEMAMGSVGLARVFSPSNTVAHVLPATPKLVCSDCLLETPVAVLFGEDDEDKQPRASGGAA